MPVAALQMYDWPELRPATDALWAAWRDAIRARGLAAPEALTRDRPSDAIWRDPDLLAAQTCGAPFVSRLQGAVALIASPCYAAEGCEGPRYRSWIIVRKDDPAAEIGELGTRRAAANGPDSLSGWWALRAVGLRPEEPIWTGAHRASIQAVADGRADYAAIDAVCWAYAQRLEPAIGAVRALGPTPLLPALPFVTAAGRPMSERQLLREALSEALAAPESAEAREQLRLTGVETLSDADYAPIARLAPS